MRRLAMTTAFGLLALLVTQGCKPGEPPQTPAVVPAGVVVEPTTPTPDQPAETSRGIPTVSDGKDGKPTRRALLVGVTKYPKLDKHFQLEGPGNDVVLMRSMLVKEFGVPQRNIVTLSEAAGEKDAKLLPTKGNIAREFMNLADVAHAGDEVIILLGGHGSQQPENPKSEDPEIDGLDEIFLPRDIGKWDDNGAAVENAITDDELGKWVNAIWVKKQAFVWLVIDACHSGTMMRGGDEIEKPRKTAPKDLGITPAAIAAAQAAADKRNAAGGMGMARGEIAKPTSLGLGGKPGVFAIYAAQPTEPTFERLMPIGEKNAKSHGILTYTICQTLTQARASNSPISYRELGHRIQQQYSAWGRTSPTPMVEFPGADSNPDREVLGPGVWKDRANILLTDLGGTYTVNAGQLVGLTSGSVLQVLPPAGMGDEVVGHVKVTGPRVAESDVTPCAFNNTPAPTKLQHGSRCKIVYVDFGDVQLRVAVARSYPSTDKELKPVPEKVRDPLVAKLKAMSKPDSLFRYVEDAKDANWLLAPWPDGQVSLMPAAGLVPDKDAAKSKGYGPAPIDKPEEMEKWLNETLGKVARFEGLLALAASGTNDLMSVSDLAPKLKIELFFIDRATKKEVPIPWPATDLTLFAGDNPQLRVTNVGRVPIDLTILYLETDHTIKGFFPKQAGTNNAINPAPAGKPLQGGVTIDASTLGTEHIVFIAVKSSGSGTNFLSLTQKGPEKLRELGPRGSKGLTKLLDRMVYKSSDEQSSRGGTMDEVQDYAISLVTWKVKAGQRPGSEPPKK